MYSQIIHRYTHVYKYICALRWGNGGRLQMPCRCKCECAGYYEYGYMSNRKRAEPFLHTRMFIHLNTNAHVIIMLCPPQTVACKANNFANWERVETRLYIRVCILLCAPQAVASKLCSIVNWERSETLLYIRVCICIYISILLCAPQAVSSKLGNIASWERAETFFRAQDIGLLGKVSKDQCLQVS